MTTERRRRARKLALTIIQVVGFIITFGFFFNKPSTSDPGKTRPIPD